MKLRFTDQAILEIAAVAYYYEEHREGLGERFERAVVAAGNVITRSPEIYRVVWRNRRRVFLRGFRHFLLYRIDETEVVVEGCIHSSRSPATWKKRDSG